MDTKSTRSLIWRFLIKMNVQAYEIPFIKIENACLDGVANASLWCSSACTHSNEKCEANRKRPTTKTPHRNISYRHSHSHWTHISPVCHTYQAHIQFWWIYRAQRIRRSITHTTKRRMEMDIVIIWDSIWMWNWLATTCYLHWCNDDYDEQH